MQLISLPKVKGTLKERSFPTQMLSNVSKRSSCGESPKFISRSVLMHDKSERKNE